MWSRLLVLLGVVLLQVGWAFRMLHRTASTGSVGVVQRLYAEGNRAYLRQTPEYLAKKFEEKTAPRGKRSAPKSRPEEASRNNRFKTVTKKEPDDEKTRAEDERRQIELLEQELMEKFGKTNSLQKKKDKAGHVAPPPTKIYKKQKEEEFLDDDIEDVELTGVESSKLQRKLLEKSVSKFEGFGGSLASTRHSVDHGAAGNSVAGHSVARNDHGAASNSVARNDHSVAGNSVARNGHGVAGRGSSVHAAKKDQAASEVVQQYSSVEEKRSPLQAKKRALVRQPVSSTSVVDKDVNFKKDIAAKAISQDSSSKPAVSRSLQASSSKRKSLLPADLQKKIAEVKPEQDLRNEVLSRDVVLQMLAEFNKLTAKSKDGDADEDDEVVDLDQWEENQSDDDGDDDGEEYEDEDEGDDWEEDGEDYEDAKMAVGSDAVQNSEDEEPAFEVWDGSSDRLPPKSTKAKAFTKENNKPKMTQQVESEDDEYLDDDDDEDDEEEAVSAKKQTAPLEDGFRLRKPSSEEVQQRDTENARRQAKKDEKLKLAEMKLVEKRARKDSLTSKFFPFDFPALQMTERGQVMTALYPQEVEAEERTGSYGSDLDKNDDNAQNDDYEDYDDDEEDVVVNESKESGIEQHNRIVMEKKTALVPETKRIFSSVSFADLGVTNEAVLRNLEAMRTKQATRIQELAVPVLLQGENAILQAQTGSGKTLAYLLPLLDVIDASSGRVQAIILAPSRELVHQIGKVASTVFQGTGIKAVTLMGGANAKNQLKHLREDRPQIIVASPGRLAEMIFKYEKLKLSNVRAIVVDEVDQMLRAPFYDEVKTLFEATPLYRRRRQRLNEGTLGVDSTDEGDDLQEGNEADVDDALLPKKRKTFICLASATAKNNEAVTAFADEYCLSERGAGPEVGWKAVNVDYAGLLPPTITHAIISCPRIKAFEMLKKFLHAKPIVQRALIFVNDPHRVELVCQKLLEMGLIAAPLHGESSKDDRKEVLSRIRDGRLRLVVTTEIAARGLDIPELTHVINFELPTDTEHYVHRTGRCGRAGKPGLAMNFATPDTKFVIRRFAKRLGTKIHDCELRNGQVYLKEV